MDLRALSRRDNASEPACGHILLSAVEQLKAMCEAAGTAFEDDADVDRGYIARWDNNGQVVERHTDAGNSAAIHADILGAVIAQLDCHHQGSAFHFLADIYYRWLDSECLMSKFSQDLFWVVTPEIDTDEYSCQQQRDYANKLHRTLNTQLWRKQISPD